MALPEITLTRDGKEITATCGECGHSVTKTDKQKAVQLVIGHLAGRHKQDIAQLLAGSIKINDRT